MWDRCWRGQNHGGAAVLSVRFSDFCIPVLSRSCPLFCLVCFLILLSPKRTPKMSHSGDHIRGGLAAAGLVRVGEVLADLAADHPAAAAQADVGESLLEIFPLPENFLPIVTQLKRSLQLCNTLIFFTSGAREIMNRL